MCAQGKGFKKKARENDTEGAARERPTLAKSRLIEALLGKHVPRPKLAEMATRENLAERARRAAEQAAAVEAAQRRWLKRRQRLKQRQRLKRKQRLKQRLKRLQKQQDKSDFRFS